MRLSVKFAKEKEISTNCNALFVQIGEWAGRAQTNVLGFDSWVNRYLRELSAYPTFRIEFGGLFAKLEV